MTKAYCIGDGLSPNNFSIDGEIWTTVSITFELSIYPTRPAIRLGFATHFGLFRFRFM